MLKDSPYEVVNKVPLTTYPGHLGSKLHLVHTMHEWEDFYQLLMSKKVVAFDTETSGFDYYKDDRIVGLVFGWGLNHFYIPVRHVFSELGGTPSPQLDMDVIRPQLQAFFAQEDVTVITHNGIFDYCFLEADGIYSKTKKHDTLILWKFVDEESPAALKVLATGWKDLMGRQHKGIVGPDANRDEKVISEWRQQEARARAQKYRNAITALSDELRTEIEFQGVKTVELKKIAKERLSAHPYKNVKKEHIHYGMVPIEIMAKYAATDTFLTLKVFEKVLTSIELKGKLRELYDNEIKLSDALKDIQWCGLYLDEEYLRKKSLEYEQEIARIGEELRETIGFIPPDEEELNLNSTTQLADAFLEMGIELVEKTDKGKWKLDKKSLNKLAKKHPIVRSILEYRKLQKNKNTYFDSLLEKSAGSGRIITRFNQNVSTGRISSSGPNFLNIPRGPEVKTGFLNKGPDYLYFFADYSQVEVRLLAHFSGDPILTASYLAGKDVHLSTACAMFGHDYNEAVEWRKDKDHPIHAQIEEERNIAKVINFSIAYGTSAIGLSEQIKRPLDFEDASEEAWIDHCQRFIDRYFDNHLEVKRFIRRTQREARANLELTNPFGRVRHLPHAQACKLTGDYSLKWLEGRAERQGPNFLIQSTAGDVFKTAVVRVADILRGTKSSMCNLVHDDINAFIHKDDLHLIPSIKNAMEDFKFDIPLIAEMSYSTTNWAEKHDLLVEDVPKLAELFV